MPGRDFSEDNFFGGNTITFTNRPFDGVVVSIAQRTIVRNNTISKTLSAIRTGIQSGAPPGGLRKSFPGKCTSPAGRFCFDNDDCNILGTNGSTCTAPSPVEVGVFWVTDRIEIDRNKIVEPFNVGIATNGSNALIRRNTITGPPVMPRSGDAINLIAKFALETATVTRNVISRVDTALVLSNRVQALQDLPASAFGARVSPNDFTDYATSVRSGIAATLSADGQGNFWGRRCQPGPAFDPNTVQPPPPKP